MISNTEIAKALDDLKRRYNLDPKILSDLQKDLEQGRMQELMDFKHSPVDIETFLTDPYFLGNETKGSWPKALDSVIEIVEGKYTEVILTGATGVSKNTRANWIQAYNLYYLSCLANPAEYCNLLGSSKIVMYMMNRSVETAKDPTFEKFRNLISTIPYFVEDYPFKKDVKSKLIFSDNIEVGYTVASVTNKALGQDFIGGTLDEMNFMEVTEISKKAEGQTYDQAKDTYNVLSARIKGRFLSTKYIPSTLCVVTSRKSENDFTEWRLKKLEEENPNKERKTFPNGFAIGNIYVSNFAQWEIRPPRNKDGSIRYSGETFPFAIGNGKHPSEVLEDLDPQNVKEREVINPPIEYKKDFINDPEKALADIGGRVSKSSGRYFGSYLPHIRKSFNDFEYNGYQTLFADGNTTIEQWDLSIGRPPINSKYMVLNPHIRRFLHFDLGITTDRCGISIGYSPYDMEIFSLSDKTDVKTYDVERAPKVIYESNIAITPPVNGRISFQGLRELIYYLNERIGMNIKYVSLDNFMSEDMRQILEANLFEVNNISTSGKNSEKTYGAFRTAIGEGRILMPPNILLNKELGELVQDAKTSVIDHPPDGTKDISDSACGLYTNIMKYYEEGNLYIHEFSEILTLY